MKKEYSQNICKNCKRIQNFAGTDINVDPKNWGCYC